MKLIAVLLVMLCLMSVFDTLEASPARIPIGAIRKGAKAVGKGLRAINIAGTVHDIVEVFKPRKRKH
ncbi:antimicrobial peptide moricin [Danaus plexippus plexippus]|uniref:Antimicrobial peptide moricin n=1 Tax=Danaus plexippus plexippus TaxID=278856 RepID=A0A212EIS3_DANPL|nr:antimicrobial peptide moricin [Danaus plexippus plexippus]